MIHVIATVRLKPGTRDEFLKEFHAVGPLVRAEVGCIDYGSAVDLKTTIAVQVPYREDVVTIVERWQDLSALEAHLAAPHMIAYRERVKHVVVGVELQVLEPV